MSEARPLPRNRRKTRSGCLRCKQRKIKCDEALPQCNQCTRRALDCPGYVRPLKWSSKYETWNSTDLANESTKDLNHNVRHPKSNTKEPQCFPPPSPKKLEGGPFFAGNQPIPESSHGGETLDTPSLENDFNLDPDELLGSLLFSRSGTDNILFESISQSQHIDTVTIWEDLIKSPQAVEDQSTRLSRHYFSSICRINCCFDSSKNPFRVWVAESMHSSPLLYHCILSMSASHLAARQQSDLIAIALEHRTEAISRLGTEILGVELHSGLKSRASFEGVSRALLACILLGMTDSWHNPSVLGLTHLHGARVLFKKWLVGDTCPFDTPAEQHKQSYDKNFLVGIMAYWEAMASFLMDQPIQSVSYLTPICDQIETEKIQSNPWTGISTPLFAYLAQAGALGRQRSLIGKLTMATSTTTIHEKLYEELLCQAREVENSLLSYKIPSADRVEDTGDALTPVSHLQKMAQIYRLTALLELYRVFPELPQQATSNEGDTLDFMSFKSRITAIAIGILTLISIVPTTSGVNALLCLPMVIAGSTLQTTETDQELPRASPSSLCSDLMSIFIQDDTHARWREFVKERMNVIHNHVGLGGVARALEVIEKTWLRADIRAFVHESSSIGDFVHWTSVMADERLETVFG